MANKKQVELLKQGVGPWNKWRKQHLTVQPDLNDVDLRGADLRGADLSAARLSDADLSAANLKYADLNHSYLINSNLSSTNMSNTSLSGALLNHANLSNADLSYALLTRVDLSDVLLTGADLSYAAMSATTITNVDLRNTKGLAKIRHLGSSYIELYSVRLPQDGSAIYFLRGTGVPDEWIEDYRVRMMHPIQYHSLFISYSGKDETLAHLLHADLQAQGVRCWFAPEDMKIGDKIRARIDEMIHQQDKLLLILSTASVASDWVEHEVEMALAKERKEQRTMLFPVRVDRAILDQEDRGWPALVRYQRHIGDFTNWTDPQAYQIAFDRLLRDLRKTNELVP